MDKRPEDRRFYDMMHFRQHGGCGHAFTFTDEDVETTPLYDGVGMEDELKSVCCKKCNRPIQIVDVQTVPNKVRKIPYN